MNDLFPIAAPAEAVYSDGLRIWPVLGDSNSPRLAEGDFVLVKPIEEYRGEGTYLVSQPGGGHSIYRVQMTAGRKLRLSYENPIYSEVIAELSVFNDVVLGIVVADIKVRCARLMAEAA